MSDNLTIAAVHATAASISPLRSALDAELPGSTMWNIIDDRLAADADAAGGALTIPLRARMLNLVRHGVEGGADAVVIACSMYGEVAGIAEKIFTTPVFASDADMFAHAVSAAPRRVAVLASLQGAAADTSARLNLALTRDQSVEVIPVCCSGAAKAASTGDRPALLAALAAGLGSVEGPLDLVCIAQYSLSPVADELSISVGLPVIAPTGAAARAVARRLARL